MKDFCQCFMISLALINFNAIYTLKSIATPLI